MSLSPYIRIPCEVQVESQRKHPNLLFKGDSDSFSRRMTIQRCETQGFESVAQAMEEGNQKKKSPGGSTLNKNILSHYGALFKNGMTDISIKDVAKEDTVLLLNYMYKGKMEIDSVATLRKAIGLAVRFNLGSLVDGIANEFDFKYHSAVLLYQLGEEFGVPRFESLAVEVVCRTFCSPHFPKKLLKAMSIEFVEKILQGDIVAESESEILKTLLEYLKVREASPENSAKLLNCIRFPHLTISDLAKLGASLSELGLQSSQVEDLTKLKAVENILTLPSVVPNQQLRNRGLAPKACILWLERRYQENKQVLILNEAILTREEKAHARAKLKLNAECDKLELPDSFEMVTIGTQMFVDQKDNEFPSKNILLQAFSIGDHGELQRTANGRIPLMFKQEVANKRLSSDGSRLVLSYNLFEKKKKTLHLGYFDTMPKLDRAEFHEIKLSVEIRDGVVATTRGKAVYVLTVGGLTVIKDSNLNVSVRHPVVVEGFEVHCIDMMIKGDLAFIYALCYSNSESGSYRQKDIVRVFDLNANTFLGRGSDAVDCEIPDISDLFVRAYSKSIRRNEPRPWQPCGQQSKPPQKVHYSESQFRFFNSGPAGHLSFVWTDTFNPTGRVFHIGLIDWPDQDIRSAVSERRLRARVIRKVFYSKATPDGEVHLARDLIGIVPAYLAKSEASSWLEAKLHDAAKKLNVGHLSAFYEILGYT